MGRTEAAMTTDTHFSIGEVLSALKDDFPDVTISKIRFLEAQGLIEPERTASGYRKFYAPDVERLRWILQQQREHFLPLRVIRGRLDGEEMPNDGFDIDSLGNGQGSFVLSDGDPAPDFPKLPMAELTVSTQLTEAPTPPAEPPQIAERSKKKAPNKKPTSPAVDNQPSALADRQTFDTRLPSVLASLSRNELLAASGITEIELREYEDAGLIRPSVFGGDISYGPAAQRIAWLGGEFAKHGLHARHLRVMRTGADRQAGLIEQVASPLLRHNTQKAQDALRSTVDELIHLTMALQQELLVSALGTLVVNERDTASSEAIS